MQHWPKDPFLFIFFLKKKEYIKKGDTNQWKPPLGIKSAGHTASLAFEQTLSEQIKWKPPLYIKSAGHPASLVLNHQRRRSCENTYKIYKRISATAFLREHTQDIHVDVVSPAFEHRRWPTLIMERLLCGCNQHVSIRVHVQRSKPNVHSTNSKSQVQSPKPKLHSANPLTQSPTPKTPKWFLCFGNHLNK